MQDKDGGSGKKGTPPFQSGGLSPLHTLRQSTSLLPSRTVEMVKERSRAGDLFTATKRGYENMHVSLPQRWRVDVFFGLPGAGHIADSNVQDNRSKLHQV